MIYKMTVFNYKNNSFLYIDLKICVKNIVIMNNNINILMASEYIILNYKIGILKYI